MPREVLRQRMFSELSIVTSDLEIDTSEWKHYPLSIKRQFCGILSGWNSVYYIIGFGTGFTKLGFHSRLFLKKSFCRISPPFIINIYEVLQPRYEIKTHTKCLKLTSCIIKINEFKAENPENKSIERKLRFPITLFHSLEFLGCFKLF